MRVGRGEVDLSHPQLTITIAIQPGTFNSFMQRGELTDAGLFNRFLIARPSWSINSDRMPNGEVPENIRAGWRLLIKDLAKIPDQGHHGWLLDFTDEARAAFDAMRLKFRKLQKPGELFAPFDGYGPKFDANISRIVGLLHCLYIAECGRSSMGYAEQLIEIATVERAECIADYFAQHAAATFTGAGMDEREQRAAIVLKCCREWIRSGSDSISRNGVGQLFIDARTLQMSLTGQRRILKNRNDLIDGCNLLVEHGWFREAENPTSIKRGPAGTWFELHPTAFSE
jgi:hypothetical protein